MTLYTRVTRRSVCVTVTHLGAYVAVLDHFSVSLILLLSAYTLGYTGRSTLR